MDLSTNPGAMVGNAPNSNLDTSNVRYFLQIPEIDGESTYHLEPTAIEVRNWSHAFKQPTASSRTTGGGSAGKARHGFFKFVKETDQATTPLLSKCWKGEQIAEATLICYNAEKPFLKVHMTNIIVADFATDEAAGDPIHLESISFNYGTVEYTYQKTGDDAILLGSFSVKHDLIQDIVS